MKSAVVPMLLLLAFPAFAKDALNSVMDYQLPATVAFNHFYNGFADCKGVEQAHVRKLTNTVSCPLTDRRDPLSQDAALEVLKHTVFDASEKLFQEKHDCMMDYTNAVKNSDEAMDEFSQKLVKLYLNRKKAQLILKECVAFEVASPQKIANNPKAELERLSKVDGLHMQFYKDCQNPKAVAELKNLIAVSEMALPFLSSKTPYDIMEKHREQLISKKTQKPMTDEEILNLNLKSTAPACEVNFEAIGALKSEVKSYFDSRQKDHSLVSKKLSTGYSERNMRTLFEEGSAEQVMGAMGLSEDDATASPEVRNMRYCLKNTYEPNSAANAYNFILSYVAIRASAIAVLGKTVNTSRAAFVADTAAVVPPSAPTLFRACIQNKTGRGNQLGGHASDQIQEVNSSALPEGFQFQATDLESVNIRSIASCRKPNMRKIFLKSSQALSCMEKVAGNAAKPFVKGAIVFKKFGQKIND